MSLKNAIANVTGKVGSTVAKAGMKLDAHSPELLIAGGVVTLVAGVVLACVATKKSDKIIEEHKEEINHIHKTAESKVESNEEMQEDSPETVKKNMQKDLASAYIHTGIKLAKLYLPAAAVIGLSVACFLSSHHVMHKRNVALSSAFAAMSQDFTEYRERVKARFGESVEKELRYNLNSETAEVHVSGDDGSETVEKTTTYSSTDKNPGGMYARFFTKQTSTQATGNYTYDESFLRLVESNFNDMIKVRMSHKVFLNEVYDALGLPICDYGQHAGWLYDPYEEIRKGGPDYNVIDLRITPVLVPVDPDDPDGQKKKAFMIDPNVEGDILKYFQIEEEKRKARKAVHAA